MEASTSRPSHGSLLQQAGELSAYVHGAANAVADCQSGKDTYSWVTPSMVSLSLDLKNKPPEKRLSTIMSFLLGRIAEETLLPDGENDFGTIDHSKALQLLEDPLSTAARSARRNALAASAFVFLMGATGAYPKRLPGFDFDLGDGRIVAALAVLVLCYQALSFFLYARSDREKRILAQEQVGRVASTLRTLVSNIKGYIGEIVSDFRRPFHDALSEWLAHADEELLRLDRARSAARHRQNWDIWLPVVPISFALLVFVARWLGLYS